MQATFSVSFWGYLTKWHESKKDLDPDDKIEEVFKTEEARLAYYSGLRDGYIEMANDIFEHLDLINYN